MTVKELFMKADLKKIAASVAADDWSLKIRNDITDEEKDQIREKYREILFDSYTNMLSIKENPNSDNYIICVKHIDFDNGVKTEYFDASMISKIDLLTKKSPRSASGIELFKHPDDFAILRAFEFCPWKEILGWNVPDACVTAYGIDNVAMAILDEMTFFGLEEEATAERAKDECQKLEDIQKDIEEHPDHTKPMDLDQLRKDLGIPDETEEEKERIKKELEIEMAFNNKESDRILTAVKEELKDK